MKPSPLCRLAIFDLTFCQLAFQTRVLLAAVATIDFLLIFVVNVRAIVGLVTTTEACLASSARVIVMASKMAMIAA